MPPPALPHTISAATTRRLARPLPGAPQATRSVCWPVAPPATTRCQRRALSSPATPALHPRVRQSMALQLSRGFPPFAGRHFHSFDHPNEQSPQDSFSDAEQAILTAAVRHIPTHGFTERTTALGAHDAGYPAISTNILPDGVFSLVRWHLVNQRTGLAARSRPILSEASLSDAALTPAEVSSRAERILWERLLGNKDVVGRWQEALAIMAQPSYVPASLRELALLADEIWALAGDKAVDPSWYTKRAAVSAIYASTELFMTTDSSGPDFPATREFLQRRFRESQELGGYVRSVGKWVTFAASSGVNVLRSKGVNI